MMCRMSQLPSSCVSVSGEGAGCEGGFVCCETGVGQKDVQGAGQGSGNMHERLGRAREWSKRCPGGPQGGA